MTLKHLNIDKTWTLFLDRDGVINKKKENDYVLNTDEFFFINGVLQAIPKLNNIFSKTIIVTNQQCIGKGILSETDLKKIHDAMVEEIQLHKGHIDQIYFAPHLANENNSLRKPNIGMALQAKKKFHSVNFTKSIIVGDSISDMEFGKNAGMVTVYITDDLSIKNNLIDYAFNSLFEFCLAL